MRGRPDCFRFPVKAYRPQPHTGFLIVLLLRFRDLLPITSAAGQIRVHLEQLCCQVRRPKTDLLPDLLWPPVRSSLGTSQVLCDEIPFWTGWPSSSCAGCWPMSQGRGDSWRHCCRQHPLTPRIRCRRRRRAPGQFQILSVRSPPISSG